MGNVCHCYDADAECKVSLKKENGKLASQDGCHSYGNASKMLWAMLQLSISLLSPFHCCQDEVRELKQREGQLSHENAKLKMDLRDKMRRVAMQEEEDAQVRKERKGW